AVLPQGEWQGPIASSYGLHLVRVESRDAVQPTSLDVVRATVVQDFNEERRRTANREVFAKLRVRYQIAIDEAALAKAATSATKLAQQRNFRSPERQRRRAAPTGYCEASPSPG